MGKPISSDEKPASSVISFKEARAIAEEHGTPTLVCDLKKVESNYKRLQAAIPKAHIYYAVKANPLPEILKSLVRLGSCFDVASKNEMMLCLEAGAAPEQLIYANPVKPPEYTAFAYGNNVRTFTFDNPAELDKIAKYAPCSEVILRMAVSDKGSVCKFSTKFGAKEKEAVELLKKAGDLGLKPMGLAFHVGSQCIHIENFSLALEMCARIFSRAAKQGIRLSMLDMGGGIPIKYRDEINSLEEIAAIVNKDLDDLFPHDIEFMAEPGRYLVGDCMTLITTVVGTATRGGNECIYIDDGVYNSLSEKIFGHCEYDVISDKPGPKSKYIIFGPTCDSMDVISKDSMLPKMEEGDILLVPSAGAYTNAAATHFNGFAPAKIVFV